MDTPPPHIDASAMIAAISPDSIRARLEEIDREARALRVLLRSAVARQRQRQPRQEVRSASTD